MKKYTTTIIALLIIFIITARIAIAVYNSKFAEGIVDYFAFFAAILLIVDALYKIVMRKEKFFPNQFMRFLRFIIGVSILTIHLLQYASGI